MITQSRRSAVLFSLTWKCFPGRSYQIQTSDNLAGGSWIDIPETIVTAGPTDLSASQALTLAPEESHRFFRVKLIP